MKISSIKRTGTHIQSSIFKNQSIQRNGHKVSPLEQRNYGRNIHPLVYAIIYGSIIGSLLLLVLH
jgi:hypothetical protein